MGLYFKDRIPDPIHGENARYYDAVANDGAVKLSDFRMVLKNNIPEDRAGDPVNAGNLNFASGNMTMPAGGYPEDIRKGDILTVTQDGCAVPVKITRTASATGPAYSTAPFANGFLKLAANKLLIMHSDRMAVATVDFNGRTVSVGPYLTLGKALPNNITVLRSFDEHPTALLCACEQNFTGSIYVWSPVIFEITGDTISPPRSGFTFPDDRTHATNPVRVGPTTFLVCTSRVHSTGSYATLFEYANQALSQLNQATLPGLSTMVMATSLFCYDRANSKYIMFYYKDGNACAIPIVVTGRTIATGTSQLLGASDSNLYETPQISGGTDRYYTVGNRIIMIGSTPGTGVFGPARIQIYAANSSGVVIDKKIRDLPLFNGSSCKIGITEAGGNRIYLTGIDYDASPRDACLLEIALDGVDIDDIKKFKAFQALGTADANAQYMKNAAYENPGKPGEFLFMQQYNAPPLTNLAFWFGNKADSARPDNAIGVALGSPEDGYVRVQTAGKFLPGLFSGLKPGRFYTAGQNGGLAPAAAGETPVGIAVSETDLQFFGAAKL